MRFEEGSRDTFHYPSSPEEHYRPLFYEVLDKAYSSIDERFNQPGFRVYSELQNILLQAAEGKQPVIDNDIKQLYQGDIDFSRLEVQLNILGSSYNDRKPDLTFTDFLKWFLMSRDLHPVLSEVKCLLKLILVLPATNAVSERSFSTLKRVKTYLRTRMTQERLNSLMILSTYKERTDKIDPHHIIKLYVGDRSARAARIAIQQ
jgi:hypothetical protein